MSRTEVVHCDYVFPDNSGTCGFHVDLRLAERYGWQLGSADYCPRHRGAGPNGGGSQPIPLRSAA